MTPPWLALGMTFVGQTEIPGAAHNSKIVQFWRDIVAPFRDDETPWCAAFVGAMLERSNVRSTRSAAARSYLKWGFECPWVVGAIVVYSRPPSTWSGHVGFLVGRSQHGHLLTLGGNQGNRVSIAPFDPARLIGVRWPSDYPLTDTTKLPMRRVDEALSNNEA